MKRNHVRWLTAIITTALLLLGAGLPAKAQLPVVDPSIIASDFVNLGKEIAQAKKQYDEFVRVYGQVADFISTCKDVKTAYKAVEDLSRIPDEVLRSQRNNKYLYDFEKIKCRDQTYALLKECMSIVKEMKKFTYSDTDPSNKGRLKLSDGDRLSLIKELKDEIVTLRNKAYQIVGYYNKLSQSRSEKATTQRLFDQLNGYK
ncbi:hypothetical protein PORUE0001_0521 [Porphyromonas uenonis 60-3]|uniref:Conjugative transposon protein TraI n=1 Tax=Porphyromonas uenonis 60-3 TaxID=596327 RepID=C2MBU8_9PORP|nr:hypothetical protein [Porphyromonas uenonis]EEK16805.1 hypothetical protein PORUE0001_0521 [Porphyromonas uenonis 60-3]